MEDNLLCLRHRPFVPRTTQSDHAWPVVANLVRTLQPTAPDQIWVADITYIRLDEGFVYLAVVLDAFSRKVVGWALADHLRAELAVLALLRALRARRPARVKREQIDGRPYRDLAQARADIGSFIDTVYNRRRLHSALGYRSPEQFETWHQAILNPGEGDAARANRSAPPSPAQPIETANPTTTMQRFSP